jgi:hypothetical protein
MRRAVRGTGLLVSLLVTHTSAMAAQEQPVPAVLAWGTVGLGVGTPDGFAGVAGFDLLIGGHLVSARATGVAGIIDDEFWDFGVLYGRTYGWSRGRASVSAGLAMMDGQRCAGVFGGCEPVNARLSLPLAARVSWHALPFLGLGLYAFANLNGEESFGGAAVTVELGRLGVAR